MQGVRGSNPLSSTPGQRPSPPSTARVTTGQYFEGKPTPKRLSARELDRQYQERAWQLGCRLVADAATASDRIVDRG